MIKEARLVVRLIALWVIFIGSLGFMIWSVGQFAQSSVTLVTKGYEVGYGYVNSYNAAMCLQSPSYPNPEDTTASSTAEKAAIAKYKLELEKYESEYKVLCEQDIAQQQAAQAKQDQAVENQYRTAAIGSFMAYLILSILSGVAVHLAFKEIKRSELA